MFKNVIAVENKVRKINTIRLKATVAFIAGVMVFPTASMADPANSWDYDAVLNGAVSKDTSVAGLTDISVGGGNGFVEGNADIYEGHTVNVTGDSGATFAYRDNRADITSTLNGNLNSNMKLVIIDRDGVFFGSRSVLDVQSVIATSGNVSVSDIMDGGALSITDIATGGKITIDQNASITAAQAGLAAFVAPNVVNNGVINARLGSVILAAGETATLDLYGDGLVEVALTGELADALIENKGDINAEGGLVQMTALAAKDTLDNIVNNEGVINASSATVSGGKIILSGGESGTIKNNGTIDTSEGGSVEISGERFQQGDEQEKIKVKEVEAELFVNQEIILDEVVQEKPAIETKIVSGGSDVTITTSGNTEIYNGYIDAQGGDLTINNDGVFYSDIENTLRTEKNGEIELNQNQLATVEIPQQEFEIAQAFAVRSTLVNVGPAASIQNAIDAVNNTGTGTNTINVSAGTFNEAVEADHDNLVLNGANAGIHGDSSLRGAETIIIPNSPGFYVTSNNVTIDGFAITGGSSGVYVDGSTGTVIKNNDISDQYHENGRFNWTSGFGEGDGIFVGNSGDTKILDNKIHGMNDDGIQGFNVTNTVIKGNRIYDAADGDSGVLIMNGDGQTLIERNNIDGTRMSGVHLIATDNAVVVDNTVSNAGTNGVDVDVSAGVKVLNNKISSSVDNGVNIDGAMMTLIEKNTITGGAAGVYVDGSTGTVIKNNDISDQYHENGRFNWTSGFGEGDGIFVGNSGDTKILDNKIHGMNDDGIQGFNVTNTVIKGNRIYDAADGDSGVLIMNGDGQTLIERNNIDGTRMSGVHLIATDNAVVVDNTVSNAGTNGVDVDVSAGVKVLNNKISSSVDNGVNIDGAMMTLIEKNTITGGAAGVYVDGSTGTVIKNNDISDQYHENGRFNWTSGFGEGDGIFVGNSGDTKILDNKIHGMNDDGIQGFNVTNTVIKGNRIYDAADGDSGVLIMNGDGQTLIERNNIDGTRMSGVHLIATDNAVVVDNTVSNAGTNGVDVDVSAGVKVLNNKISSSVDNGVNIDGAMMTLIEKNTITGGAAGVYVDGSTGTVIKNNDISDQYHENGRFNWTSGFGEGDGIFVGNSGDTKILDNKIHGMNDDGIQGFNVTNTVIKGNRIYDAADGDSGVLIMNGDGQTLIERNNIDGTRMSGVHLIATDNAVVVDNTVSNAGTNGVDVDVSAGVKVLNNKISSSVDNGVNIDGAMMTLIEKNTITGGAAGVYVDGSTGTVIKNNDISDQYHENGRFNWTSGFGEGDGIFVGNSGDTKILDNKIHGMNDDGIQGFNVTNTVIKGNRIYDAADGDSGVLIMNGDGQTLIERNNIDGTRMSGVHLIATDNAVVVDNTVSNAGTNGVDVDVSAGVKVLNNKISSSVDNGVNIDGAMMTLIEKNTITGGAAGVYVDGSTGTVIKNNDISDQYHENGRFNWTSGFGEGDGIFVGNSGDTKILDNKIHGMNDDGIQGFNVTNTVIKGNRIYDAADGDSGVLIMNGDGQTLIERNNIDGTRMSGVHLIATDNAVVVDNTVSNAGTNGVDVDVSAGVKVLNNKISSSVDNGIDVTTSFGTNVIGNTVLLSGNNGIYGYNNGDITVDNNAVGYSLADGIKIVEQVATSSQSSIFLTSPSNATITNNEVFESLGDGIEANNISGELNISDNFVESSYENGVKVAGLYNGDVTFSGNTLTNNGQDSGSAAARFESGDIDMSDLANPNTFINTTGLAATALQFEGDTSSLSAGNGLRIVGETLGSTVFEGYLPEGSFYVRFEDGSILNPITGAPIVIDATEASFDGVVPSDFAGLVLPSAQLSFIEERLFDADDAAVNGRGQIFVGTEPVIVEALSLSNFEDFISPQNINGPSSDSSASVTIRNLPLITGLTGANLNNLEPAAGEGQSGASGLNNIEPAAGEEAGTQVTCLGDAIGEFSNGTVTYNFGGSFEDSIASTVGCASGATGL